MEKPQSYLVYNDPIKIVWRDDNQLVDRIDNLVIVNNKTVLNEIPSEFYRVKIEGYTELVQDTYDAKKSPGENEFIVNYQNGVITFHESQNGKTITAVYKGRGMILYPAERIYVHSPNPFAVENLQQFVELCETKIIEVNHAIGEANAATARANQAADEALQAAEETRQATAEAIQATEEARQATQDAIAATNNAIDAANQALEARDLAIDARNRTILIWMEPVDTYDEIAIKYPEPQVGWTVLINNSGVVYRYDGAVWRPIGNMTLSVPLASENIDGLMSRDDYVKLKNIEYGAQVNYVGEQAKEVLPSYFKTRTVVFVVPGQLDTGSNGSLVQFPWNGKVTNISASLEIAGTDSTEIIIEKISKDGFENAEPWTNILSRSIFIDYGERVDDGSHEIADDTVNANDYFRINVLRAGISAENLVVTMQIQI